VAALLFAPWAVRFGVLRRPEGLWIALICAYHVTVRLVLRGDPRCHLPLLTLLAVFAAFGISTWVRQGTRARPTPAQDAGGEPALLSDRSAALALVAGFTPPGTYLAVEQAWQVMRETRRRGRPFTQIVAPCRMSLPSFILPGRNG